MKLAPRDYEVEIHWHTMEDNRVRPAHELVDGDVATAGPRGKLPVWRMEGHDAHYPGDPRLPPHLRINCRCWLTSGKVLRRNPAVPMPTPPEHDVIEVRDGHLSVIDSPPEASGTRSPRELSSGERGLLRDELARVDPPPIGDLNRALTSGEISATRRQQIEILDEFIEEEGTLVADTIVYAHVREGLVPGYLQISLTETAHTSPVELTGQPLVRVRSGIIAPRGLILERSGDGFRVAGSGALTASGGACGLSSTPIEEVGMFTIENRGNDWFVLDADGVVRSSWSTEADAEAARAKLEAEENPVVPSMAAAGFNVSTITPVEGLVHPTLLGEMAATGGPSTEIDAGGQLAVVTSEGDDEGGESATFDFEGPLVLEGVRTGDGREIGPGALTWRDLPLPLMLQTQNPESGGHAGARFAGSITEIERVDNQIIGRGNFDAGEAGQEAKRLVDTGMMRGVSADLDMVEVEFRDAANPDTEWEGDPLELMFGEADIVYYFTEGRLMGATMTPFPAMQEAHITPAEGEPVLVASGFEAPTYSGKRFVWSGPFQGEELDALVASGGRVSPTLPIPVYPAAAAFDPVPPVEPHPVQVNADFTLTGYVALWGSCHIGFKDRCVDVPRSMSNYALFRTGTTLTAEGTLIPTGAVYLDGGHAPLHLGAQAAKDWMAETSAAVADVAVFEDNRGIYIRGALRPDVTPAQLRAFRGGDVSPDWRRIGGNLECVAMASVNTSGYIVPALVASGDEAAWFPTGINASVDLATDEVTALVASGAGGLGRDEMASLARRVEALEAARRRDRADRALGRLNMRTAVASLMGEQAAVEEAVAELTTTIEITEFATGESFVVERTGALASAVALAAAHCACEGACACQTHE